MNPLPAWARGYDRLWYANANAVREGLVALVAEAPEPPHALVLELDQDDADVRRSTRSASWPRSSRGTAWRSGWPRCAH